MRDAHGTRAVRYMAWLFVAVWAVLALQPYDRADWALENALTIATGLVLFLGRHRYVLSRPAWTMILMFGLLHVVGAHYTYSRVPYEHWSMHWGGRSLNRLFGWERNNFDRVVHFCYGLLLALPLQEWLVQAAGLRGAWRYWFPLEFVMATSMLYELLEWLAASFFGGDLGTAYLGTQGDAWDSQKDMALAMAGAVLGLALVALAQRRGSVPRT